MSLASEQIYNEGYQAGHAAGRAEAEALLRETRAAVEQLNQTHRCDGLLARIDAFLKGGTT